MASDAKKPGREEVESDIKTEVIVHLREEIVSLRNQRAYYIEQLVQSGDQLIDALQKVQLERLKAADAKKFDCICDRHVWDTRDGWHRQEPSAPVRVKEPRCPSRR